MKIKDKLSTECFLTSAAEQTKLLIEDTGLVTIHVEERDRSPKVLDKPVLSPMLQEYLEHKTSRPNNLLFFQVGDFFELFFDDAVLVAKELNLTLTSRDKNATNPVPMCGVPVAAVEGYLSRLVDLGYSCSVVEQIGDKPTTGGPMERGLTRVLSPSCRLLSVDATSTRNILGSYAVIKGSDVGALVWFDADERAVYVRDRVRFEELPSELGALGLSELVLSGDGDTFHSTSRTMSALTRILGERCLHKRQKQPFSRQLLESCSAAGFEQLSTVAKQAVRSLYAFLDDSLVQPDQLIDTVLPEKSDESLIIDALSLANLEVFRTARSQTEKGSLFSYLNRCQSIAGKKMLERWLRRPLRDRKSLEARYEAVSFCIQETQWSETARKVLKKQIDYNRIAGRLALGKLTIKEILALASSLSQLTSFLDQRTSIDYPFKRSWEPSRLESLVDMLTNAFGACENLEKGPSKRIFREGFDEELDTLYRTQHLAGEWLVEFESVLKQQTGINSLKVRHNNVLGYFIEVTKSNISKVPDHFLQRQTMVSAVRYVTEELKQQESAILNAAHEFEQRQDFLIQSLLKELSQYDNLLHQLGRFVGELDVILAFAELSQRGQFIRPELQDRPVLALIDSSHPILVDQLGSDCVPNSVLLGETSLSKQTGENYCLLLTGPNMGGKSTYLRQAALAVILAQIGCFVPASEARIGIVDQIFARLGASDDLYEGDSTFMVEMKETAYMLKRASKNSLVLVDEIGRGTATRDGYAIATAVFRYIVEVLGCRSLFATHFHELTELADSLPGASNVHVSVYEEDREVVFTHTIKSGPARRSYGLEVAALAGVPSQVLEAARGIFNDYVPLEVEQRSDLGTKSLSEKTRKELESDKLISDVATVDIHEMRPVEALVFLDSLIQRAQKLQKTEK